MKELAQKAFDQWESVSNLKFNYNSVKTYLFHFLIRCFNIIIIDGAKKEYVLAVLTEKVMS
jgi:hypothetical protein